MIKTEEKEKRRSSRRILEAKKRVSTRTRME
jgi:hypothetical protein